MGEDVHFQRLSLSFLTTDENTTIQHLKSTKWWIKITFQHLYIAAICQNKSSAIVPWYLLCHIYSLYLLNVILNRIKRVFSLTTLKCFILKPTVRRFRGFSRAFSLAWRSWQMSNYRRQTDTYLQSVRRPQRSVWSPAPPRSLTWTLNRRDRKGPQREPLNRPVCL